MISTRCMTPVLLATFVTFMFILPRTCRGELIAYYNFDDGQTVTDQVDGYNGTVLHNAGFAADTPDGSPFSLDLTAEGVGTDQDYVRIGPPADGGGEPEGRDFGIADTNSFTIAAWVKYSQSQRGIVTIKQDLTSGGTDRSGITFGIDANENLFFGIIASTGDEFDDMANTSNTFRDITTEDKVPVDEWVHIAGTYDFGSDAVVGYINGTASEFYNVNPAGSIGDDGTDVTAGAGIDFFDNDGAFTGFGAAGNGPLHGDSAGDFTRLFYDGLLDEVGIWDEALSAQQIQDVMNNGVLPDGATRLRAGDADQDLDFDQLDLVQVSVAGKYLTGQAASWGEGDWNGAPGGTQGAPPIGDGQFNQLDIIAALNADIYLRGPYAALQRADIQKSARTSLIYHAATGELVIDAPLGSELTSISVSSEAELFTGDRPAGVSGAFDNFSNDNIFKATFGASFGTLRLGRVLPAELSEETLLADLSASGSYAGGDGFGEIDLVYVPEGSSILSLILGLLGFVSRRDRRVASLGNLATLEVTHPRTRTV